MTVAPERPSSVYMVCWIKKPSWDALRRESAPIEAMRITGWPEALTFSFKLRVAVPAYPLRGYEIRAVAHGFGRIPLEQGSAKLKDLEPGEIARAEVRFKETNGVFGLDGNLELLSKGPAISWGSQYIDKSRRPPQQIPTVSL